MTPEQAFQAEKDRRMREAFLYENFGDASNIASAYPVGDTQSFLRGAASASWVGSVMGRRVNPKSPEWQGLKDGVVRSYFKNTAAKDVGDDEFFGLIAADYKARDQVAKSAFEAVALDTPPTEMFNGFNEAMKQSPAASRMFKYQLGVQEAWQKLNARLSPHRELIDSSGKELSKAMKDSMPDSAVFQGLADKLLSIPEEDRRLVIRAIGIKGGATDEERRDYLSKIGAAAGRMTETFVGGVESQFVEGLGAHRQLAAQNPEDMSLGLGILGLIAGEDSQAYKKTQAYQSQIGAQGDAEVKRARDYYSLVSMIRKTADEMDPLKSDNWWGQVGIDLARMGPMVAASAIPGAGLGVMAAQSRDDVVGDLLLEYPDMSVESAYKVANVASIPIAAAEHVTNKIPTGKLPFLGSFLKSAATSYKRTLLRGAAFVAGGTAVEVGEEGVQQVIPAFVQDLYAAVEKDVSYVNWDEQKRTLSRLPGQVIGPAFIMSLVGGGVSSVRGIRDGRALAGDKDLMIASGIAPAQADAIVEASGRQDWSTVDDLFQSAFSTKKGGFDGSTDAERAAAIQSLTGRIQQATVEETDAMAAAEVSMRKTADGWTVSTPDSSTTVADYDAAYLLAVGEMERQGMTRDEQTIRAFEAMTRKAGDNQEFVLSDRDFTALDELESAQGRGDQASIDAIQKRAEVYRRQVNSPDLPLSKMSVLGRSSVELRDEVKTYVQTLYSRGSAVDLVEEKAEADVKRWIASDRTTLGALRGMILQAEKATGDTYLHGDTDTSVIEAYSTMARLWATGTRKGDVPKAVQAEARNQRRRLKQAGGPLTRLFQETMDFFREVLRQASRLAKARRAGTLGDIEGFLNESLGLTEEAAHVDAVGRQVQDMGSNDTSSYSFGLTERLDSDYMAAIKAGDMDTAQKMVEKAAKAAGFTERVYHGTKSADFEVFQKTTGTRAWYGVGIYVTRSQRGAAWYAGKTGRIIEGYAKAVNPLQVSSQDELTSDQAAAFSAQARRDGYDSIEVTGRDESANELILFDESQIKLADPVTMDAQGKIIPLSQRFNPGDNRITYSFALTERLDALSAALDGQTKGKPEARRNILERAQDKLSVAREAWEAIDRQAKAASRAASETPDRYGEELAQLRADFDAEMTEIRTERETEIGGAKVDKAGKETVNRIKAEYSARLNRRRLEYERDRRAIEDRQASEEAAQAKEEGRISRQEMNAALRTLDAVVSVLPPELRGKVGGFIKLSELNSNAARIDEIESRFEKVQDLLETYFRKELTEQVEKLFERYRPERASGEKPKGKLDPDAQELVDAAEAAMSLDADKTAELLGAIDAALANPDITAEQEVQLDRKRVLVELFGDWRNADAGRMSAALDALKNTASEGWAKWRIKQLLKREERQEMRNNLRTDSGISGVRASRQAGKAKAATPLGKLSNSMRSMSSFAEFMETFFGKSKTAGDFLDAERKASNGVEDDMQGYDDSLSALFTQLGNGSVMRGEQIHFRLSKPTIKTDAGPFSELEAITAILMWRQPDGQRHMQGHLDESGKAAGEWHYDQAFVDKLQDGLSAQGRAVLEWIARDYGQEYNELNPIYRERYGVNLPKNDRYAPLSLTPRQSDGKELTDPLTGAVATAGVVSPGFFKTRSSSAIAEPEFRDAIHVWMAHKRMMSYWKHYQGFASDFNAVMGNRDVRNVIKAKAGDAGTDLLREWQDYFAQGGIRDASASLTINRIQKGIIGRAAQVAILGRATVLFVQATQIAAASVKMPVGAYLIRLSKLLHGDLSWGAAIKSDFIQRRIKQGTPLLQQMMKQLGEAQNPNAIRFALRWIGKDLPGKAISGLDGVFTAGTYAILLDYHRTQGAQMGLEGTELEAYASNLAERDTEAVAQPTRGATRSMAELTATHPSARLLGAFISEARQKLMLFLWAGARLKQDPAYAAKAAFLTFVVGGVLPQVIKNLWRDAKGDDDEEKWSVGRLAQNALTNPFSAVPGVSALTSGSLYSNLRSAPKAAQDLFTEDQDADEILRDVDTVLSALGLFSDSAAALAVMSHAAVDAAKIAAQADE